MFVSLSDRAQSFCQRASQSICRRASLSCALGLVIGLGSILSATAKDTPSSPAGPDVIDLFAGMEDGKVQATVVPRDAKRVTLQLKNKSDRPITIRLPEAFAAVPVQAQLLGGGNNGIGFGQGGGNQAGGQGAQGLGVAGGGQNGGNRRDRGGGAPGIFNVPAGKVIKVKLTSVCLEYGKPEPSPRNEYVLQPIEALCDKPEVVSILSSLGDGEVSQEVAQLAAWNVANGIGFEQIAALPPKLGSLEPIYSPKAISAAAKLVVAARAPAAAPESTSAKR
jgi:hypothetical protein